MPFYSNLNPVDINSIELICLYIEKHIGFSNSLLGLNASYSCFFDEDKICIKKTNYKKKIDKFTNIHLICGMNGVGKSTILNLIKRPNDADGVILLLKSGDTFISNRKISFTYNNDIVLCDKESFDDFSYHMLSSSPSDLDEGNLNFHRGFLMFYVENKTLFSDIDEILISHFFIEEWKSWDNLEFICNAIRRRLGVIIDEEDLEILKKEDFLTFIFCITIADSSFEDWIYSEKNRIKVILADEQLSLREQLVLIRKIIINEDDEKKINRVIRKIKNIIRRNEVEKPVRKASDRSNLAAILNDVVKSKKEKENSFYSIKYFNNISVKFLRLCSKLDECIHNIYSRYNIHYLNDTVASLYYFRPVKIYDDNTKRYLEDLSHGEFFSVKFRHDLYKRMFQSDCAIILDDEPDRFFHAEWSRTFTLLYINSIKKIREYISKIKKSSVSKKNFNIVLTTHSPIILSDFYNEKVIFLEKEDGKIIQRKGLKNCFAGNIAEILLDNFFIKRTIGAYSEKTIKDIVEIFNSGDLRRIKKHRRDIELIISKIGDSLIKCILTDQAQRVFDETNKN